MKTQAMVEVEERFEEPLETLIPRLYDELPTEQAVAEKLGIARFTLYNWRFRLGIKVQRKASVEDSRDA